VRQNQSTHDQQHYDGEAEQCTTWIRRLGLVLGARLTWVWLLRQRLLLRMRGGGWLQIAAIGTEINRSWTRF
jgi:hypothetical protein